MADVKISALTALPVAGTATDELVVNSSGTTYRSTVENMTTGLGYATEAQARAGVATGVVVDPLQVANAIDELAGDVVGPASSTDSAVALYDGTTGKALKDGPTIAAGGSAGLLRSDGDGSNLTGISVEPSYPPGFVYNAKVTINSTDSEHDLDMPQFSLRNDDNDANIDAGSSLVKQMDTTFAEGTNAGGMASGESLPTSGVFYVFAVTKDSDGTVDVMGDTDSGGANINTGWTAEKLLARVTTDSSANIDKVVNFWINGEYIFDSDGYTITYAGSLTIAHGLSGIPQTINPRLLCVTANLGYSIGDDPEINKHSLGTGVTASSGVSITKDATNIYVRYGSSDMRLLDKGTGNGNTITSSSWRLVLRAEL